MRKTISNEQTINTDKQKSKQTVGGNKQAQTRVRRQNHDTDNNNNQ